jgi:hypothetical protein
MTSTRKTIDTIARAPRIEWEDEIKKRFPKATVKARKRILDLVDTRRRQGYLTLLSDVDKYIFGK